MLVLLGVILPVLAMLLLYGRQAVQDSPAHGATILFLTLPIAGSMSLVAVGVLTIVFYEKFSN